MFFVCSTCNGVFVSNTCSNLVVCSTCFVPLEAAAARQLHWQLVIPVCAISSTAPAHLQALHGGEPPRRGKHERVRARRQRGAEVPPDAARGAAGDQHHRAVGRRGHRCCGRQGGAAAGRWCSELAAALAAGWRAAVHALQRSCLRSRRGARRSLERIVDAAAPAAGCGADTQRPSGAQHRSGGRPGRGALVPSLARKARLSGGSGGGDGARTDEAQSLAASEAGCRGRGAKAGALRRSRRHRHSATAALRRLPPANSRPHRPPLHPSAQPTHLSVLKANAISDLQRGAHEGAALREWC